MYLSAINENDGAGLRRLGVKCSTGNHLSLRAVVFHVRGKDGAGNLGKTTPLPDPIDLIRKDLALR